MFPSGCNFTATGCLRENMSQPNLKQVLDALESKFEAACSKIEAEFAKFVHSDSPPQWFLKYIEQLRISLLLQSQTSHSTCCFSHDKGKIISTLIEELHLRQQLSSQQTKEFDNFFKAAELNKQQSFKLAPSEQQTIESLLQRALTEIEATKGDLMELQSQSSKHTEEILKLEEKVCDLQQGLEHKETILLKSSPPSTLLKIEDTSDERVEVQHSLADDLEKVQDLISANVKPKDSILSNTVASEAACDEERNSEVNPADDGAVQREEEEEGNNLLSANVVTTSLGEWEKHTKGFGSKIMAKLGYVMGSGLGKKGEGRTEPVEAIVLPRGKSLDCCMAIKEKAKVKRLLRVKKQQKRQNLIVGRQDKKFIEEQTAEENHFQFSFDISNPRTSTEIQGNQEVKNLNLSLESDRYELGEIKDETCHKVPRFEESVVNQEGTLILSSSWSSAAKSGIASNKPALSQSKSRVSSFEIKNLKVNIIGQLNRLISDSPEKMSASNFTRWLLHGSFKKIDVEKKLDVLVHILHVRAIEIPAYAPNFAEILKLISKEKTPSGRGTGQVSLCQLVLNRCQQIFEKQINFIEQKKEVLQEIETEEKNEKLLVKLDKKIEKEKQILSAKIRFIGELFKVQLLTIEVMDFFLFKLLRSRTEEQLECLCELISSIGKAYEQEYDAKYQRAVGVSENTFHPIQLRLTNLDVYLDEMRKICRGKTTDLSSRIRLMLIDVLDLKERAWAPRKKHEDRKQSLSLSGNQEVEAPTLSIESERYELGGINEESSYKVCRLEKSVLNQEEVLSLPSGRSSAAENWNFATEPALSQNESRVSIYNERDIKNLKIATIAQLNRLIFDNPKSMAVLNFKLWLFRSNFKKIDCQKKLEVLVHILHLRAVDEPMYAPNYAVVCKLMFETEVPSVSGTGQVSFRRLLLDKCQQTFEKEKKAEEEIISKQKALQKDEAEEKKMRLQMELNARLAKSKRIMLGNIKFIGELFKLQVVTIKIMNFCISKLLNSRDEEQLECLCKLISTIGKTYEEKYDARYQRVIVEAKSSGKESQMQRTKLDVYLNEMCELSQSKDLSSHIRLMLMGVLDLKQNRWVPRREEEKPKTIEIRGELQNRRLKKELSLEADIIKSLKQDDRRVDVTKKSRSTVDDEGWQTYQGKKGSLISHDQSSYLPPPPRMTVEPEEMKPEPTSRWSKDAGFAQAIVQTVGGRYSALLDDEDPSLSDQSLTNITLGPPLAEEISQLEEKHSDLQQGLEEKETILIKSPLRSVLLENEVTSVGTSDPTGEVEHSLKEDIEKVYNLPPATVTSKDSILSTAFLVAQPYNLVPLSEATFPEVENDWVPDTIAKIKVTDVEKQKTSILETTIVGKLKRLMLDSPIKMADDLINILKGFKIINAEKKLNILVNILYVKAIHEPIYAPKYAEVCKLMFQTKVPSASGKGEVSFHNRLIERCLQNFERGDLEEIVFKQNIRFAGELFKLGMLTTKIMFYFMLTLLNSRDEEQLECLSELISTIGKTYEEKHDAEYQTSVAEFNSWGAQLLQLTKLDVFLDEVRKLSQSEDVSSRIRSMLLNILDLKQNQWVQRRKGEEAKTVDEVHGELQKERPEKELQN